ncbi:MAG: CHASE2 domain-containing protein [Candidatus Omnitrophica bacterium]|nr:CHASE2 domain-containing protein [Candidatus Omnitrophota bacterium]
MATRVPSIGKTHKKILLLVLAVVLVVDILSFSYYRILDRFELVTLDFRYSLRLAFLQKINPDIVIIEIGEDTLQGLGRWPLPRDYHASLIDVLNEAGSRMVMFDILFCEPSGWDAVLADSIKKAGNVYLSFAYTLDEKRNNGVMEAVDMEAPLLEDLKNAATGAGFINKMIDADGKVRSAPPFVRYKGGIYPSVSLKMACDYLGTAFDPTVIKKTVPIDERGAVLINFAGRWVDTFKHYSYLDILAAYQEISEGKPPRMDLRVLKDKVCFVGLTATGTQDIGPVPVESAYPMIGIHANLFNMFTNRVYLRRFGREGNLAVLILLAVVLLFFIRRVRPYLAFLISMGFVVLLFISAILLFVFCGLWIDIVCPSLILFGAYLAITIKRYITEIKVREKIQRELMVAASIQQCFLPAELPSVVGLDIAVSMKTAKEVGGDLYDFLKLDDERTGIMIGDVSGKGVPASLFMSRVETLFRVYSKSSNLPSEVLSKLNNEVASDERSGLFTTLIYAIFDSKKKELLFSDAGHLPLLIVHGQEARTISFEEGMAVGIMEGTKFIDKTVKLPVGSIAVLYTDGVSEARDVKSNEFGIERLTQAVKDSRLFSAQEIVDRILKELKAFQGRALQHDDITVAVLKSY